jgi:hypothetical protein
MSSTPQGESIVRDIRDDRQKALPTFVSAAVTGQIELCNFQSVTDA